MSAKTNNLSTSCVHAETLSDQFGSPHTPLYDTTTFGFTSTAHLLDVIEGRRPGNLYTRYGMNPTITSLEAKLATLDRAESALAFSSGMAAISAMFLAHGHKGIICVGDAYGGTLELLSKNLPELGVPTRHISAEEIGKLPSILGEGAGLVFFETPTNPKLEIIDVTRVATAAHACGALVAVDNTFASPVNQQPLSLGADLVVQSATKYLGGHSDITAGVVAGNKPLIERVGAWRRNLGQILAPQVAHLLARSLSTLVVRVERQNASALSVAKAMKEHPRIRRVYYPGLPDSPGHELAASQMSGFGGMVTIDIDGSGDDATRVADRLKVFTLAPSLGGVESLVTQPATTSHHDLSPRERQRHGITDSMIRLSIGLEDAVDLIHDLESALGE